MIDTDKYEGHTEGPWSIRSPVSQVTKKYRGDNEGKVGLAMSEWPSYGVAQVGPCSVRRYMSGSKSKETWHANIHLIADAPLLLEEVKRLQRRLMLAESALGEIRAYHESGQGNLGEIIEHYQENEQVEMPNAFDED